MRGTIPPLHQYAFMAWCSVKAQRRLYTFTFTYGGVDLTLDGGEWSASSTDRINPEERAPDSHWMGGWVCPKLIWTNCKC
jgi:hypothetical protein